MFDLLACELCNLELIGLMDVVLVLGGESTGRGLQVLLVPLVDFLPGADGNRIKHYGERLVVVTSEGF